MSTPFTYQQAQHSRISSLHCTSTEPGAVLDTGLIGFWGMKVAFVSLFFRGGLCTLRTIIAFPAWQRYWCVISKVETKGRLHHRWRALHVSRLCDSSGRSLIGKGGTVAKSG